MVAWVKHRDWKLHLLVSCLTKKLYFLPESLPWIPVTLIMFYLIPLQCNAKYGLLCLSLHFGIVKWRCVSYLSFVCDGVPALIGSGKASFSWLSRAHTHKQNVVVTHASYMCCSIFHLVPSSDFREGGGGGWTDARLRQTVQQHGVKIYLASVRWHFSRYDYKNHRAMSNPKPQNNILKMV